MITFSKRRALSCVKSFSFCTKCTKMSAPVTSTYSMGKCARARACTSISRTIRPILHKDLIIENSIQRSLPFPDGALLVSRASDDFPGKVTIIQRCASSEDVWMFGRVGAETSPRRQFRNSSKAVPKAVPSMALF